MSSLQNLQQVRTVGNIGGLGNIIQLPNIQTVPTIQNIPGKCGLNFAIYYFIIQKNVIYIKTLQLFSCAIQRSEDAIKVETVLVLHSHDILC